MTAYSERRLAGTETRMGFGAGSAGRFALPCGALATTAAGAIVIGAGAATMPSLPIAVALPLLDRLEATGECALVDRASSGRALVERAPLEPASVERASGERALSQHASSGRALVERASGQPASVERASAERALLETAERPAPAPAHALPSAPSPQLAGHAAFDHATSAPRAALPPRGVLPPQAALPPRAATPINAIEAAAIELVELVRSAHRDEVSPQELRTARVALEARLEATLRRMPRSWSQGDFERLGCARAKLNEAIIRSQEWEAFGPGTRPEWGWDPDRARVEVASDAVLRGFVILGDR